MSLPQDSALSRIADLFAEIGIEFSVHHGGPGCKGWVSVLTEGPEVTTPEDPEFVLDLYHADDEDYSVTFLFDRDGSLLKQTHRG